MITFKRFLTEGIGVNLGDIAEAILGSGITAKFALRPTKDIQVKDIIKILNVTIVRSDVTKIVKDVVIKQTKVTDSVRFRIGLPKPAEDFLKNPENFNIPEVSRLFKSVVAYVNTNKRLIRQAKVMSINAKHNEIFINSDGIGNQRGTKADIKIIIDGKETRNQISLKTSGGDQFAQVVGDKFSNQKKLWSNFNLDVSTLENKYNKTLAKFDFKKSFFSREELKMAGGGQILKEAGLLVYKDVESQFKKMLADKSGEKKFVKQLIKFIREGAAGSDPNIELVKLDKGSFKSIRFDKSFDKSMKKFNFDVELKTGPTIRIFDKVTGKTLIKIRSRIENKSFKTKEGKVFRNIMRNVIESGNLLFELGKK